jgi:phosphoglycerol transferase MdoB-like AlkP superfamily enzyme
MVARMTSGGWIISHRCSWITVYVLYCNAQVNLIVILMTFVRYLYSINCPTVICLPSMLLFILWRDTTSELWTPVHSFTLLLPFTFYLLYLYSCKLLSFTTRYAQSFVYSKPVRLTTSLWVGTKYLVVLCAGSMLLLVQSYTLEKFPGAIVRSCCKASRFQPSEVWFFLLLVR